MDNLVNEEQYHVMTENIEELEKSRDNSTRMFKAVYTIHSTTKKPTLYKHRGGNDSKP